jgi:Cu-processing system ATP-binding protein
MAEQTNQVQPGQKQTAQERSTEPLPVQLQDVSKAYGDALVLDNVNLTVAAGESLVLVGHNGAGKTTLMKLLLGLVRPGAGKVRVFGDDPMAAMSVVRRRSLGYLPESIAFDEAMTGHELLKFYAGLKGVNEAGCDALLTRVGIADAAHRRLSTWSKGMRQRLGLAQAMLGHPRILLLDEPTSGLDPSLRSTLYEIIETLRADGVTVLISSHALNEVEEHVDRVAIMRQGSLLACGTLAELNEQAALPVQVRMTCAPDAAVTIAGQLQDKFAGDGAHHADVSQVDNQHIELVCTHPDKMAVLRKITGLGDAVIDVDIRPPRLDEIYAHFMAGDITRGRRQ